jgi:hypothetical protein
MIERGASTCFVAVDCELKMDRGFGSDSVEQSCVYLLRVPLDYWSAYRAFRQTQFARALPA